MTIPLINKDLSRDLVRRLGCDEARLSLLEEGCEILAERAPGLLLALSHHLRGATPLEVALVVAWAIRQADRLESEAGVELCACGHLRRQHARVSDDREPCDAEHGCGCKGFSLRGEGAPPPPSVHVEDRPAMVISRRCACGHDLADHRFRGVDAWCQGCARDTTSPTACTRFEPAARQARALRRLAEDICGRPL